MENMEGVRCGKYRGGGGLRCEKYGKGEMWKVWEG